MTALYDAKYEEPPAAARLRVMIKALASGAAIDADLRTEIIDALKRHEVRRANDKARSAKGREIEYGTWYAATIAKELIDHHGAKTVKDAIGAAAESLKWQTGLDPKSVTTKEHGAITRAYQKLNKSVDGYIATGGRGGGKFTVALITPAWMEDAAARLNGKPGSGATPVDAHGVIAILSDPGRRSDA
jgi:ABC-type proline/glycine betaine transport system substrate-binding protein